MKAVFSASYRAQQRRIANLPKYYGDAVRTVLKRDAATLIDLFRKGIMDKSLGLENLKPVTITSKKRKGYERPEAPLYGEGAKEKRSYANALRIYARGGNGYSVRAKAGEHHSSGLPLKAIFEIHEFGKTITMKNGRTIKIPPRPALRKANERLQRKLAGNSNLVKQMVTEYIKTGKSQTKDTVGRNLQAYERE